MAISDDPSPWSSTSPACAALRVHLLACVDLDSMLTLQEVLAEEIMRRVDRTGVLLICEHPSSITVGRDGTATSVLGKAGREMTNARWLARGGGAWKLSPGQLAVYAILPLERMGIGLADYRQRLCQSFAAVGKDLKLDASCSLGLPGATTHVGQYAFLGGAVRSGVSLYGGCLLVSVASEKLDSSLWGSNAVPLGAMRQQPGLMSTVRMSLVRHLASEFGYSTTHVVTGHPQLRRTKVPALKPVSQVSQATADDAPLD